MVVLICISLIVMLSIFFMCLLAIITALLTIVKTWKQSKCPLRDDWIKKRWYMYTTEYYSSIKKNK